MTKRHVKIWLLPSLRIRCRFEYPGISYTFLLSCLSLSCEDIINRRNPIELTSIRGDVRNFMYHVQRKRKPAKILPFGGNEKKLILSHVQGRGFSCMVTHDVLMCTDSSFSGQENADVACGLCFVAPEISQDTGHWCHDTRGDPGRSGPFSSEVAHIAEAVSAISPEHASHCLHTNDYKCNCSAYLGRDQKRCRLLPNRMRVLRGLI